MALGLALVVTMIALSVATEMALAVPVDNFTLEADRIDGKGLRMYAENVAGYGNQIVQELDEANITNLKIVKEMNLGGATIRAVITGVSAVSGKVLMKCTSFSAEDMVASNQILGPYGGRPFVVRADTISVKKAKVAVTEMVSGSLTIKNMVISLGTS